MQLVFGLDDDLFDKAQGELPANDRELLQQSFLLGGEAIDACSQDTLHSKRNMQGRTCVGVRFRRADVQVGSYTVANQDALFDQLLYDLFHEEWRALGLL